MDRSLIPPLVALLQQGGVVALPTETIYGLCCDPRNTKAVDRLFQLKERDTSKPVLCVTGERSHIDELADIPSVFEPLLRTFWPGPLTVILPLKGHPPLSPLVQKDQTIALRLTSDPLLKEVTTALRFPLVATSANMSGKPFLRSAEDVRTTFGTRLDLIMESDHPLLQTPSTIIALKAPDQVELVREGTIPFNSLKDFLPFPR